MVNSKYIPLMVPDIQGKDIDAMVAILKSGSLIQGSKVEELENNISNYLGVRHAIAASSGTATLHLALIALGIGKGDEVIVPAFSFIATANVIELVGAKPVFVDIDLNTYNIDKNMIEQAISSHTKAIIPVHEFGLSCDIIEIYELAQRHKIKIIEDAACALGAKDEDRFSGTIGDIGCFSFHPRKIITSGEGGILVTNNDELARKLRFLRNHGAEIQNNKIEYVAAGFNYRLTDFQAAFVNNQFNRLESILEYKNRLAGNYYNVLRGNKKITLPRVPENKVHTWQSFHVLLDDTIDRNSFIKKMAENGIGTNYGAQCIPYQQYFQAKYKLPCEKMFPNALEAYNQGLVLPLYEKLCAEDILSVASVIEKLTQ